MQPTPDTHGEPQVSDPSIPADEVVGSIEAYRTDDGVVVYDAEAPLAWIQSTRAHRIEAMR